MPAPKAVLLYAGGQPYQYTPEQIIGMMVPPAICMDSNKLRPATTAVSSKPVKEDL